MKRRATERQRAHLDRGERVFMPPWRIREIRWEESVVRSRLRRDGFGGAIALRHSTCHCGSLGCVNVPWVDPRALTR